MWGPNDKVNTWWIVLFLFMLFGLYTQLLYGWGERIEWLQSLSPSEYRFLTYD